jgi:hypothetical protein
VKRHWLMLLIVLLLVSGLFVFIATRPNVPPGFDAIAEGMTPKEVQTALKAWPFAKGSTSREATYQTYNIDGFEVTINYVDGLMTAKNSTPVPFATRVSKWFDSPGPIAMPPMPPDG